MVYDDGRVPDSLPKLTHSPTHSSIHGNQWNPLRGAGAAGLGMGVRDDRARLRSGQANISADSADDTFQQTDQEQEPLQSDVRRPRDQNTMVAEFEIKNSGLRSSLLMT